MSLDALLDAVERRGRQEVERVLDQARAEAAAVERAAESRLAERRADALRELEARVRGEAEARLAAARREARARVLRSRERLLEAVFEAVMAELPDAAASERYRSALPDLLAEALRCVDARGATLECAAPLRDEAREILEAPGVGGPNRQDIVVRSCPEADTGIRLLSADGRALVDATLAARLERLRPRLAIVVLAALGPRATASVPPSGTGDRP
ncbi:MAG: V-type ATP synthase subunit E family protein [Candidatus Palauibacterales bacterium]|nr:V-type ATP synthase subunit E family protein [Candidatus Palauibacterales bacterium]MDP2529025.1 V-type ATP synthase subunit E family protein [Candidatus Palauibacterales bacterium]MDP2583844.1 V-type ATP synthase subunit E family protein [Candidatus Palauibacterales bacterium]